MSLVGKTLDKYQIVEEIGHGGMATIYRAYQPSLNRHVAIKVLSGQLAKDETFRQRFAREAKAVAQLSQPNILPIYDFGEQPALEALYIVTELIEGGTLKAKLGAPLNAHEAVPLAAAPSRVPRGVLGSRSNSRRGPMMSPPVWTSPVSVPSPALGCWRGMSYTMSALSSWQFPPDSRLLCP